LAESADGVCGISAAVNFADAVCEIWRVAPVSTALVTLRDAWASRTTSASGVVSMAFAKIGFVLLCTIPSKMFPPGNNELIEMFEDDLSHFTPQTRRAVVFKNPRQYRNGPACSQYLHSASPFTACTCIGSLPSFE